MRIDEFKIKELISNYEFVKPRIIERLASKEIRDRHPDNRILAPIRHTNLAMEYAIDISEYNKEHYEKNTVNTYVCVTHEMLAIWGVNVSDIKLLAKINTPRLLPSNIQLMSDLFGLSDADSMPVVVVTNHILSRGAGAIFYKSSLNKIKELLSGDDFYIIPSSTHEVICVSKELIDNVYDLLLMVKEVNDSGIVDECDILDYDIYEFISGVIHSATKH